MPEASRARRSRKVGPLPARGLAAFSVVGLHIGALGLFALPPMIDEMKSAPDVPIVMTSLVPFEDRATERSTKEPMVPVPVIALDVPDAGSLMSPILETDRVETADSNEFRPPHLLSQSDPDPTTFAAASGLSLARAARVILTVTVTEQGTAGNISVMIGSGDADLDSVAIEYARTLRWHPALVRGRETSMSIRLPVVFSLSG